MRLRSSRTLPFQGSCDEEVESRAGVSRFGLTVVLDAGQAQEVLGQLGMSSRRARSGGTAMFTTLRRS